MKDNPFDPRARQRRFGDPDLTRRILEQTSGSACARAEELLAGRWDGDPDPVAAELLAAHLERCSACATIETVLARLRSVLPHLAEREPGPDFTAAVLAATCGQEPAAYRQGFRVGRTAGPPAMLERCAIRLRERLQRAWQRPRFALEAAWTTASLASLLLWSPILPQSVPEELGGAVRAGTDAVPQLVQRAGWQAEAVAAAAGSLLRPAIAWTRARCGDVVQYLGAAVEPPVENKGRP